jgi:hypothetical protein
VWLSTAPPRPQGGAEEIKKKELRTEAFLVDAITQKLGSAAAEYALSLPKAPTLKPLP